MLDIAVVEDEKVIREYLCRLIQGQKPESRIEAYAAGADLLASGKRFDLVFLDPPYALVPSEVLGFMGRLREAGLLAPAAIVSYEHDGADDDTVEALAAAQGWRIFSHRRFGDTAIDLMELA